LPLSPDEIETIDTSKVWHHYMAFDYWRKNRIILESASGCTLTDVRGRSYIDAISGVENVSLGHCNPAIVSAIIEQAKKLIYAPIYWTSSVPQALLADKLLSLLPKSFSRVFFVTGGSEANETALKMLRQYYKYRGKPLKHRIISRWLSYHGATLAATAMTGQPRSREPFEPLPEGFIHIPPPHCDNCPLGKTYPDCGIACAELLEDTLKFENRDTVAGFIADPVQLSSEGLVVPPKEYFPTIRRICDENDVKLVFDEIVTAFGRTGRMFCFQHWNVTPDVISLGKGITGGHVPLAAVAASGEICDQFESADREFRHVFTYGGYPIGCAAALASISEIERGHLCERSERLGHMLRSLLIDLSEKSRILGEVKAIGLLASAEIVRDKKTKEHFDPNLAVPKRVEETARKNGLIIRSYNTGVSLYPALTIDEDLLKLAVKILGDTIAEVESQVL